MTTRSELTLDIVMPFYGDPEQFREAVHSVRAQTDSNWRLIVVNDCYPHWDPDPWLAELHDARIMSLRNPHNLGVSRTFARCADLAEAEYTTIMGCDDRLLPEYVALLRTSIRDLGSPDYLQPGVQVIDEAGRPATPLTDRVKAQIRPHLGTASVLQGDRLVASLMRGNWTYFPAICWRTERLKHHQFSEEYEIVLDLQLQFDILLDGGKFGYLPQLAFEYRRHSASASSYTASDGTRFDEERAFYRTAAKLLSERGWDRAAHAARRRATSRLNALTKVPGALVRRDGAALRALLGHAFSR